VRALGQPLLLVVLAACANEPAPLAPSAPVEVSATPALEVWSLLRERYDADRNGRIDAQEYPRGRQSFAHLDADEDGVVSAADFAEEWNERAFPPGFSWGEGGPELGDPAPDFRLDSTRGETIELASFRNRKPVALIFGSFT
jgi:hypothetical protein